MQHAMHVLNARAHVAALNLGEVLRGSRIYNTPYVFDMGKDQVPVCARALACAHGARLPLSRAPRARQPVHA